MEMMNLQKAEWLAQTALHSGKMRNAEYSRDELSALQDDARAASRRFKSELESEGIHTFVGLTRTLTGHVAVGVVIFPEHELNASQRMRVMDVSQVDGYPLVVREVVEAGPKDMELLINLPRRLPTKVLDRR